MDALPSGIQTTEPLAGLLGFGTGAQRREAQHAIERVDRLLLLAERDENIRRAEVSARDPERITFIGKIDALVVRLRFREVVAADATGRDFTELKKRLRRRLASPG